MRTALHVMAALVGVVAVGPRRAAAVPVRGVPVPHGSPAADSTGFVVRQGADTVAIERARRVANGRSTVLTADVVGVRGGGARLSLTAAVGPDALISRLDLRAWRPGAPADAAPAQTAVAAFRGDTVYADSQAVATRTGALPYYNIVVSLLEQIVRRARVLGAERGSAAGTTTGPVDVPVFVLASGGRTVTAQVTPVGADSVTLALAGTELRLRVDAAGTLLGGRIPAQGIVIERVAAADVAPRRRADAGHAAPPGAPYAAEEVVVRSPDGPRLAGTLTLPRGVPRAPAVVLVSGSSPHDRDYTAPRGYRLFWWLADTLSRRGIAVLRLDNRGVGGSTGNHDSATTAQRAGDVRAAVAFLRTRPDIDGARIGLVGISEGGLIAPMLAAADTRLRGIVLMAAPGETGRTIAAYQYGFRVARDTSVRPAARDSARVVMLRRGDSASAARPWMRWLLSYDPLPTARRVRRTPVLLLQGTTDQSVPPADATRLATAFRAAGNPDVTVRLLPGLDHIFVPDPDGDLTRYDALPSLRVPPSVLGIIADWTSARM